MESGVELGYDNITHKMLAMLNDAVSGKEIPPEIKNSLALLSVEYYSFQGDRVKGSLVIHKKVTHECEQIFHKLMLIKFPIERMTPINFYDWDDQRSMEDNNTSAFNYRFIAGTSRLSNHALGLAIDINPRVNPYIGGDGTVLPIGAVYQPGKQGVIDSGMPIVALFKKYGWKWGGDWKDDKDWQHFERYL